MTDFERLEDLGDGKVWSTSALKSILKCGAEYDYRYQQDLVKAEATPPLAFGSAVHKVIETLHKDGDKWEPAKWQRLWSDTWFEYSNSVEWPKEYHRNWYDKSGTEMISRYIDGHRDAEVLESEWAFPDGKKQYKIGKFQVKGIIDQIRRTKEGRLLVVDLKTSKTEPNPFVLRADPQFTIYAAAVHKKYGEIPDLAWLHLKTGEMIYTRRNLRDFKVLELSLAEAQYKADNKMFARNVGYHCNYCSYLKPCLGWMGENDWDDDAEKK